MKVLRILLGLLVISFVSAGSPYTVFVQNGKAGLKDQNGRIVIPAEHDALGWSNGAFSLVNNVTGYRNGHKWGLINLSNHRVTRNEFVHLYPADGSLVVAARVNPSTSRQSFGCISLSGKQVIPFLYDGISIAALRAIVFTRVGNQFRYGLIDLQNKTLIPQQYQEVKALGSLRYAVKSFDGKIAVFSENGQQMTSFNIDSVSSFKNDLAVLYQGRFVGVIDREGKISIQPKYREISIVDAKQVAVRQLDQWTFLESTNKPVRVINADSVVSVGTGLYKIVTANQAELVDDKFNLIGSAVVTDIGPFQNRRAVYRLGGLYGVLMSDAKVLIPALYQKVILNNKFILASQRQTEKLTWTLFDSLGNRKVNRAYESIEPLTDGFFKVVHRGFFGVINSEGREVVACAYDSILQSADGCLAVKFKGLYGALSLQEEWIVSPRKNRIRIINRERFIEFTPTSTMLKERNGNVIYFSSNPLEVHEDHLKESLPSGTVWKIDLNGVIVDRRVMPVDPVEKIYEEFEGYRAIKRNGKYGFIDSQGRLRIANRYEAVQPFSEGYAAVKILGKWGFINTRDNIAVQPVYEDVKRYVNGYALVKQKGLFGLIDKAGKLVLPVRYEKIDMLSTGNFMIQQKGMKGISDQNGRVLIQPKYDRLEDTGTGFVLVVRNDKFGVVSYNGVSTVPLIYEYMVYDRQSKTFLALQKAPWETIDLK